MERRIFLPGGRYLAAGNRRGVVVDHPPEMEALLRWENGDFLDVERSFAKGWRRSLEQIDLSAGTARLIGGAQIRDRADAKRVADEIVQRDGERYAVLRLALDSLKIPNQSWSDIIRRWKTEGGPRLAQFAPYAAYVLTVNLFFALAMGANLESTKRPSHRIDLAYLYYLPFCYVFTSYDKLHERTATLFLRDDQAFVRGSELKSDLAKLNDYYSNLPQEIKEQGVMKFAHYPPVEGEFLTAKLWDKFMSAEWRKRANEVRKEMPPDKERELVEMINRMKREGRPAAPFDSDDADELQIQRRVPLRKGSWRLLPREVEEGKES
jgi:hypothetical protein